MKAKDLKRFEEPFKVELGKIDALGCGRKENLVVLEFNLYSGKGTHRDPGDEYVSPINLVVHNRITTGIIMSVSPSDEQLSELIRCGLNPLYEKYLKKAHDLIMKNCWLKYTRLVPSTIVAGIIDNLLMVEKISKM